MNLPTQHPCGAAATAATAARRITALQTPVFPGIYRGLLRWLRKLIKDQPATTSSTKTISQVTRPDVLARACECNRKNKMKPKTKPAAIRGNRAGATQAINSPTVRRRNRGSCASARLMTI